MRIVELRTVAATPLKFTPVLIHSICAYSIVEPAVRSFEPGLLIVSAGFDAHVDDPLAHMAVTADGFRDMAARCMQLAPQVGAALEGGYNLETLPGLVEAALDGFNS